MLKNQIATDMIAAMKAKNPSLGTLRMLKADIMKYEVSGPNKSATDEVVLEILKRSIKQRKEAAEGFKKGGNLEAAEKETNEISYLEKYMPEQLSEDEVKKAIQEIINQLSAGPGDFGKVMGMAMGKLNGKADGGMVNKVVKTLLS